MFHFLWERSSRFCFSFAIWGVLFLLVSDLAPGASVVQEDVKTKEKVRPPNILLISLCSVRPDHMSCYGYHRKTTPYFETLANTSIVFEKAISQWPKTAPFFAALVTGKYGHTNGVMRVVPNQFLGDEHETFAEILQAQGYETGVFTTSGAFGLKTNIIQGFDTVEEVWRSYRRQRDYILAVRLTVDWLEKPREKPFFAWIHFNNAHQPYEPADVPPDLFVDDQFYDSTRQVKVNPPSLLNLPIPKDHPCKKQILRADLGGVHPQSVLEERPNELDFYIARYDAAIHSIDVMVNELFKAMEKMGLMENTIVAVVGDHGEALGEHNYFFRHGRFPYDDCARVALMIRPVGGVQPRRIHTPVAAFGLTPTLLEMVGIKPPAAMEAKSLLPIIQGTKEFEYVFTESGYQLDYTLSVRDTQWKLIHIPNEIDRSLMTGSEYEMYDLDSDPGELHNLYQEKPEVGARLRKVLEEWSEPWVADAYGIQKEMDAPEIDDAMIEHLRGLGYLE